MSGFVTTVATAIVGILAAILTNWLLSFRKKADDAQDWYEQHYIFNGIDPLIHALSYLNYYYAGIRLKIQLAQIELKLPIEEIEKIQVLLNGGVFRADKTEFRDAVKYLYTKAQLLEVSDFGSEKMEVWVKMTEEVLSCLCELRIRLLEVNIRRKHEVYSIYKREEIPDVAKKINTIAHSVENLARLGILKRFPPYNQLL